MWGGTFVQVVKTRLADERSLRQVSPVTALTFLHYVLNVCVVSDEPANLTAVKEDVTVRVALLLAWKVIPVDLVNVFC
jgi:hypothetical protein